MASSRPAAAAAAAGSVGTTTAVIVVKENGPARSATNMERNESEPLLDHKNTRGTKHVEIRLPEDGTDVDGWHMHSSRKDKPKIDRHKDRRSDEMRKRHGSQHSEAGSTEYSHSETGAPQARPLRRS